jgi:ABC-2 type transport system permease protein
MIAIFKKEINAFFSSLIGYITIGVFLLMMGLFLWVFPETNLLDYGYSSLDQLFSLAPNIFLFLIPAITMRSFAEETQSGTMELLATHPVSDLSIIMGKYLACSTLVLLALLPTSIYYVSIYLLGDPVGNIDTGSVIGSYIGLALLGAAFTAIGIFASACTSNQIVSFILAVFICFMCYLGFELLSTLPFLSAISTVIENIGMNAHYNSLGRGLLDSIDIVYFFSIIALFFGLTRLQLERRTW